MKWVRVDERCANLRGMVKTGKMAYDTSWERHEPYSLSGCLLDDEHESGIEVPE